MPCTANRWPSMEDAPAYVMPVYWHQHLPVRKTWRPMASHPCLIWLPLMLSASSETILLWTVTNAQVFLPLTFSFISMDGNLWHQRLKPWLPCWPWQWVRWMKQDFRAGLQAIQSFDPWGNSARCSRQEMHGAETKTSLSIRLPGRYALELNSLLGLQSPVAKRVLYGLHLGYQVRNGDEFIGSVSSGNHDMGLDRSVFKGPHHRLPG